MFPVFLFIIALILLAIWVMALPINPPLTTSEEPVFKVGNYVEKYTGDYHLEGRVIGVVTTSAGNVRYVVEHGTGLLHIYSAKNLRLINAEESDSLH